MDGEGFADAAFGGVEVFEGFEAGEGVAGFGEGSVDGEDAVVGDGGEPSGLDLEHVELLVLLEVVGKGVAGEVEGEEVAGRQAVGMAGDSADVEADDVRSVAMNFFGDDFFDEPAFDQGKS